MINSMAALDGFWGELLGDTAIECCTPCGGTTTKVPLYMAPIYGPLKYILCAKPKINGRGGGTNLGLSNSVAKLIAV